MPTVISKISLRHGYLLGFLCCVGLMAAAYYFEYVEFLEPCPLCMVQRLATVLVGVGFLSAFIFHNRGGWWLKGSLLFTLAAGVFGIWAATHHIWIQGLPPEEAPACGPGFDHLMATLPLSELIKIMLQGDGNCAEISWSLWGLSMPAWVRLWFVGFVAATGFALFKVFKRR